MEPSHHRLQQVFPDPPPDIDLGTFKVDRLPGHVAVIMDGNGRWAEARQLGRIKGHSAGIRAVRELIRASNDIGVRYLTIYSFSTENWSRPVDEVQALMLLFAKTMAAELEPLYDEDVRIRIIGDISALPKRTANIFKQAVEKTCDNRGMTLTIAVNYGSRQEILQAARILVAKSLAAEVGAKDPGSLTAADFEACLDTHGLPDPDLLIRTSGEFRLSNFLLYQIAYSEVYVSPVLWPDFDRYELLRAILAYQGRERRYGGLR
ncbi:MAG: polyprenyl diphosphate synthase [Actinomycetia bacterium]|nr:polyprenyl diphosphate synthase [Actinomycetes bacterium]